MAEELNMMAMDAESTADLAQDLNVEAALELDAAQTQAANDFNINNIVSDKGGPQNFGQPSAPVKPNVSSEPSPKPSDFMSAMNQVIDSSANEIFVERHQPKTLQEKINPTVGPKARYAGNDLDLYRYQDDFDPIGFDPFNPKNYEHWTEKETWGTALSKGFDSFGTRFGNTFTDSFASYGRIFDAVANADWDLLKPTEDQMIDSAWEEHKESMKNFTFVPPEEEEDIFSKRTISEFIGNAGFAMGTFAALGVELVADAALTFVTGGAGAESFLATAARFGATKAATTGAKVGARAAVAQGMKSAAFRFTDFVADVGKGAYQFANQSTDALSAAGKVGNKARQAETIANAGKVGSDALRQSMKEVFDIYTLNMRNIIKSKSLDQLAMNIAKGVPILGTGVRYGEKIVAGAKGGLSAGKLAGIGLMGGRRMVQEFNMSSTEAGFEAVTGYSSTLDMMVNQYRADNDGKNPTATEFAKMQDKALKSSAANYNTNLAILLATNRIQFGGLFNRFAGSSKWTKELLEEGVEKTLNVNRLWKSSKQVAKVYEKGFFGTYGLLGKISKDFGRKQAVYEFGKQFMKDFAKFEVTEGLQENMQEMSGAAWKYYYAGQYNGTKYTLNEAFEKGLDEQFTKQGLRTFLQGALTGGMIRPMTATIGKFTDYLNEKAVESNYKDTPAENPYVKMREQLKRDINLQNDIFNQMSNKKLEDNIVTFTNQVDSALRQTEAAAKGAQYEWQNAKDNIVLEGALAANRSGSIAAYRQAIREMGKTMTNEEFEAAFGIALADTKYETAEEFANAMADDVKKYSDTIDGIRRKVKNLPDPLMYEKGSKQRLVATIMHNAQEDAIKIIALNAMKATRASERAQAINQELLAIPGFANSAEFSLRVLANPENFKGETGNIQSEIKILQESLEVLEPEQREAVREKIKNKQRQLELLDTWLGYWDNRDQVLKREDAETGETGESVEKIYDTFIGVSQKVDEYDENGVLVKKDATVYKLDDETIIKTFREFINLRNKELGINEEISEQALRDSFDKIVDFIRLDQDAKDYMRAMDLMYNPEYYRATISNMESGRFKYELLEFVDSVNERIRSTVMFVVANADLPDMIEKIELFGKLDEELQNAITESEPYKNLVLLGIDENLGLDNAKFAQENVKKLNEIIQDKIAEILDKYAPSAMSDDLSDLDYEAFQKTKKVSGLMLNIIARKIESGRDLSERQGEVYDANKELIDPIVQRLKDAFEGKSTTMEDATIVSVAKERLVDTGEFEMVDLDVMDDKQILDLALTRNLITPDEALDAYQPVEVISDEVYQRFNDTLEVDDAVLTNIATRDLQGIELSLREREIMEEYSDEISEIQSILEEERLAAEEEINATEAVTDEDEVVETAPIDETEADEENPEAGATISAGEIESMEAADQALLDAMNRLDGTDEDGTNASDGKDPFETTGSDEEGYTVTSKDGTPVNNEPIESEEKALELTDALNVSRMNIDWSTKFLGDLSADEEAKYKLDRMTNSGKKSLTAYNKANNTDIKTLEDYYKIPEGKRNLDDIKESILTNTPLAKVKSARKRASKVASTQSDLFDNTTSSFVGGPALPLSSIESLHSDLKDISTAAKIAAVNASSAAVADAMSKTPNSIEMSEKIGKFDREESLSENDILDQLRKLNSCYK
jgi:hypothetical protein